MQTLSAQARPRFEGATPVPAGDTLFDIAERECGDGSLYQALAAMNNIEDPNLIYAGANLVIDCEALQGSRYAELSGS